LLTYACLPAGRLAVHFKNMKDIITIDGPSGAGKSTVSKLLAQKLGYRYLDTGAFYRAVAWKIKNDNVDPEDEKNLSSALKEIYITFEGNRVMVNRTDVTSQIRTPEVGELSSRVSAKPIVRQRLYAIQREIGLKGKVVIEGRDIGTVIFPEAKNKFFLDANLEERGRRRYKELKDRAQIKNGKGHKGFKNKNPEISLKATIEDINKRDKRDLTRRDSPLKKTPDMIYINTGNLTVEEVVTKILEALRTS
jgi:cytidylate kinase